MSLQKGWIYNFFNNAIGESIFTAPGILTCFLILYNIKVYNLYYYICVILVDKWKVHRRLINPAFNINLLKQFLPIFYEKSLTLINNLQIEVGKTQPFDLWNYMLSTTLDMICRMYIL